MPEPTDAEGAMLRDYLAQRDVPCPSCGYNLRGLPGRNCPECSLEVRLGVQLSEARVGLLVSAIVGLMFSVAPAAALLLFVVIASLRFGGPSAREAWVICGWPAFVLLTMGTCTILLARAKGRRWFRKIVQSSAAGVAWGAWVASVVVGLIYGVIIATEVR